MSITLKVDDAINWLNNQPNNTISNFVTGICDMNEIKTNSIDEYLKFFESVVNLIFDKVDPNGYAIFIQTDRKHNKTWVDKSFIISKIAYSKGFKMVWHKIVLHRDVNKTNLFRPTYAHMLCYTVNGKPGSATPDVIPVSKTIYCNATPIRAVEIACEFIKQYSPGLFIADPFVGRGTTVNVAQQMGIDSVGIDIDPKQIAIIKKNLKR